MRKTWFLIAFAILLSLVTAATITSGPTPPWRNCKPICDGGQASGNSCINLDESIHKSHGSACNSWNSYFTKVITFWIEDSNRDGSIFEIIWNEARRNLVGLLFIFGFGTTSTLRKRQIKDLKNAVQIAIRGEKIKDAHADFWASLKAFHLEATNLMRIPATQISQTEYMLLQPALNALEQLANQTDRMEDFNSYRKILEGLMSQLVLAKSKRKTVEDEYAKLNEKFLGILSGYVTPKQAQHIKSFNIKTGNALTY